MKKVFSVLLSLAVTWAVYPALAQTPPMPGVPFYNLSMSFRESL